MPPVSSPPTHSSSSAQNGDDNAPVRPVGCCASLTLEQKWFRQFFVGILICVNNGACFTFGIFSPFMKKGAFRYTQTQVNVVSTVGVFLSYFSVPNGYLYDTRGPRATLLAGTILNVTGWAGLFLVFLDMEHPLLSSSIVVMSLFYALSQFSASFYETGSVLTNLRAFSCYKGRVVLIQKTFMGLGSSIVAQMYVAFFERTFSTIAPFFLFLVVFSSVAGILSVLYVRLPGPGTWCLGLNVPDMATLARGGGESSMFDRPFNVGTVILVFAVGFVLFVSLVENFVEELSTSVRALIGAVTVGLVTSFISMMFITPSYAENVGGYKTSAADAARCSALMNEEAQHDTETMMTEAPRHKDSFVAPCEGGLDVETSTCDWSPSSPSVASPLASLVPPKTATYRSFGTARTNVDTVIFTVPVVSDHTTPKHVSAEVSRGAASIPVELVEKRGEDETDGSGRRTMATVVLNDSPLLTNLRHREIWLLWFVCFASWGSMTLVSSNSSQIYQAVAYEEFSLTVNTVFVSIYGVASAVGRIVVGAGQPIMERRHIPIASFLIAAPLLNIVGLPLFLLCSPGGLFLPFFIVGFATGVSWGSTVLVVTGFFVINNAGKHYSWLYTAGMLSPLVFNISLFGPVYGHYSRLQGRESDHSCKGTVCIQVPLMVCTFINFLAIPCAYYFTKRTSQRGGLIAQ